jgi:hypothetical protein
VAQGAEPSQRGGDDVARQRAVAVGEKPDAVVGLAVVELLVKRTVPPQYAVEDIRSDAPRRQTRHFGFGRKMAAHCDFIPAPVLVEGIGREGRDRLSRQSAPAFRQEFEAQGATNSICHARASATSA